MSPFPSQPHTNRASTFAATGEPTGIKHPEDTIDTISSLIKKYLKATGIGFDRLPRKVEIVELQRVRRPPWLSWEYIPR